MRIILGILGIAGLMVVQSHLLGTNGLTLITFPLLWYFGCKWIDNGNNKE